MAAQNSSGWMSKSSMVRNRSDTRRWMIRLWRVSPVPLSRPLTLVSRSFTSWVFSRLSLMVHSLLVAARTGRRGKLVARSAEIATGHWQGDAGDVGGLVRRQEQDRRRLFLRGAVAFLQAGGDRLLHHLPHPHLVLRRGWGAVAGDAARR